MKIAIMGKIHDDGLDILKNNNCEIIQISNFDEEYLKKNLIDVNGIVIRTAILKSNILAECNKLKIVSRHGVGYDNIDTEYLKKNQIALGITGTSNAVSVAEHVMTMFLYLAKKIYISHELTKNGKFNDRNNIPDFFELYKKNILIFGFGRIGKEVAKRCNGFDANVYVYDPYINDSDIKNNDCYPIDKDEGLKIADYITIHLPLNEKTKNFISFEQIKNLKKDSIIVNTARGGIVNEEALYIALKEKKIGGAGLDVFDIEPPIKNHLLFSLENIILTPHNAALTLECRKRMAKEACENVYYYLSNNNKLNKRNILMN
tara:strand:- start:5653 stop:6606 length:954 start_codon:yes stop_codon:yes gene_type:complete